jgi:transposase-like protein
MVGQTCQNSLVLLHSAIMSKIRRSFSPEDRYSIVQEALREGHAETCRKYTLSPSLLRKWRQKYLAKGREGLANSYPRVDP